MFPVKDNIRTERVALVTLLLIAVNVGVYIWACDDALAPLAANLGFLWIFGNSLEEAMGPWRYLAFYVLGGLLTVGALLVAGADANGLVGATGASVAVLGGYLVHYPHGRVLSAVLVPFWFTIVAVPAVVFLGVWGALQVVFAVLDLNGMVEDDEAIAYLAPLAGLAFGAIAVKLFATHRSPHYLTPETSGAKRR